MGRVNLSDPASISSGIAARYARALFDLAKDKNILDAVDVNLQDLSSALEQSDDLRKVINSPIFNRVEQGAAMLGIARKLNFSIVIQNTLALMASKRRLFVLPAMIKQLNALIAAEKNEVNADVV